MRDLEELTLYVHNRLASIQRMLDLSCVGIPQNKMKTLGQKLFAIEELLEMSAECIRRQREQLQDLKTLEQSLQRNLESLQHLQDNIPKHMPKKKTEGNVNEAVKMQPEMEDIHPQQPQNVKKIRKSYIKEMETITIPEYESIPQYMKGRVSYDQLNAAVNCINLAVATKYKIVQKSVKTLNGHSRNLHQRFKEQETKDTKGHFFVVEGDIQEFTRTKVDKPFQGILCMLRHCHRLKEVRGGGLTRYILL